MIFEIWNSVNPAAIWAPPLGCSKDISNSTCLNWILPFLPSLPEVSSSWLPLPVDRGIISPPSFESFTPLVQVQVWDTFSLNSTAHNPVLPPLHPPEPTVVSHSLSATKVPTVPSLPTPGMLSCPLLHLQNTPLSPVLSRTYGPPPLHDLILLRIPLPFMIWHLAKFREEGVDGEKNASFRGRQMRFKSQFSHFLTCDPGSWFILSFLGLSFFILKLFQRLKC